MSNPLLEGRKGERHLLLGNEAIVRGALEAGVHVVTCYPGTPSSEVPDTFYKMGGNGKRYYMQYSVNEKVAMEVACGAALGGAMALVTMKLTTPASIPLRMSRTTVITRALPISPALSRPRPRKPRT